MLIFTGSAPVATVGPAVSVTVYCLPSPLRTMVPIPVSSAVSLRTNSKPGAELSPPSTVGAVPNTSSVLTRSTTTDSETAWIPSLKLISFWSPSVVATSVESRSLTSIVTFAAIAGIAMKPRARIVIKLINENAIFFDNIRLISLFLCGIKF